VPTYTFINKETKEITEHKMLIAEYDDFKKNNPHLERYISFENLPVMSDGIRLSTPGTGQPDSTFEKYIIGRMKATIPGNRLGISHKTKSPREW